MPEALTLITLLIALCPLIYYAIAIFSSLRFFYQCDPETVQTSRFTPPVSQLKPIKGVDPDAYENFASFCRQDYPDYELLFCVDGPDAPAMDAINRLKRDFPERSIRVLFGSKSSATNDKVAKLTRLVNEALHEVIVISDSDVRVRPDYLRTVVARLSDPEVGAVTLPYASINDRTLADCLQTVGMFSDFFAGIFVARQLDGIKFALGPTIATTKSLLSRFGGYSAIEDQPGDDLLVGRLIAEQGYRVEMLNYPLETVADFDSLRELLEKRLRWKVVMRCMRPWGHLGLIFTQGLPWSLLAAAVAPSLTIALLYLSGYVLLRVALTWTIGVKCFRQDSVTSKLVLIPVWDAIAFTIWIASFMKRRLKWRGSNYYIREGRLVPIPEAAQD